MQILDTPYSAYLLLPLVLLAFMAAGLWRTRRRPNIPVPTDTNPEKTLRQAEEKYRDLFENANDVIFILDEDYNYVDVNRKAVEVFGYSREEFLRLNVKDVIPPEQRQRSDDEFTKLDKNGGYERFVGRQRTKDGRWLDIEVNSSAIVRDGKVIGSRDIVRDISERRQAERERERLIAKLQQALEEIKTLKGIIPICSFCKRVRVDQDYWEQVDIYIKDHSEADISHGICPECLRSMYPDFAEDPD